ncbi:MAG: hypothetical protein Kow0040_13210 [Thermogutta sp.]
MNTWRRALVSASCGLAIVVAAIASGAPRFSMGGDFGTTRLRIDGIPRLYPSTRTEFIPDAFQADRVPQSTLLDGGLNWGSQVSGNGNHSSVVERLAEVRTTAVTEGAAVTSSDEESEGDAGSAGKKVDSKEESELELPDPGEMEEHSEAEEGNQPPAAAAEEGAEKSGMSQPGHTEESEEDSADSDAIGNSLAAGIARLLRPEVEQQLASRGVNRQFEQWRSYAASRLNATAGPYGGSEINGLARLSWFDQLLRDPLRGPVEAEEFTRKLHAGFRLGTADGMRDGLQTARPKMDVSATPAVEDWAAPSNGQDALEMVKEILLRANAAMARAVKPLEQAELSELSRNSYSILTTGTSVGHTINSRGSGVRLCRLIGKMDRAALFDLAETLAQAADPALHAALSSYSGDGNSPGTVMGAEGPVVSVVETEAGTIVVGGKGGNVYRLDEMKKVAVVIDLGGNDVYVEGSVNVARPILIVIDLGGDDRYQGTQPGIQGGAVVGGSILVDVAGNDVYSARDIAQGSALVGVGMLVDLAGNDRYVGFRRVQGQALGGVGLLIDREGKDDYRAAMWGQGMAGPWGFAALEDAAGDDHYYIGGNFYDSYPETPGYDGWGQGVGAGIRGVANGGIGVILEGAGDDEYEFDYFAQGGGYWLGMGFARDFAGNDKRLGATRNAYNGSARTQQRFQRFGNGWACHYAVGFLIDDAGDDSYDGTIMGTGFGWDLSAGFLIELDGNDQYLATVGGVQGQGAQASLGVLYDFAGEDVYKGTSQGYASGSISYHPYPTCGGNFSFVVDYGGTDQYGCRAQNNAVSRRGSSGGFIVDRPKKEEIEAMQASMEKANAGETSATR